MAIEQSQDYLHTGSVEFQSGVKITTGAAANRVLTSDASGNASWQAIGGGAVQSATVTLSSAQILSLHTTPINLVAAQGANTFILPIALTVQYTYGTTDYVTDDSLRFTYDGVVWTQIGSALAPSQNVFYIRNQLQNVGAQGQNFYDNANFQVTTPSSNPTGGDGTVKITVLYSVINL